MQTIRPEFHDCARRLSLGAGNDSETDSEAETIDNMTLEMEDNSFQILMKRVDYLLGTGLEEDVREAFEMTRRAWQACDFGEKLEQKLEDKLEQIADRLRPENAMGNEFMKRAAGLEIVPAPQPVTAPAAKPVHPALKYVA